MLTFAKKKALKRQQWVFTKQNSSCLKYLEQKSRLLTLDLACQVKWRLLVSLGIRRLKDKA